MPTSVVPSSNTYHELVQSLKSEIAKTRQVIEQQVVITYWTVGRSMQRFLEHNTGWGADTAFARRLSGDIGINMRTLQQALQFYRTYPKLDRTLPISWSHYRVLMSIDSPSRRRVWEKRIVREDLGLDHLRQLVYESHRQKARGRLGHLPELPRGLLYHYRLTKVTYVNESPGGLMLDCGFDNRIVPPPTRATLKQNRIMRAEKKDHQYHIVITKETIESIFTYKAVIQRVVDGDTLLANIDCGFGLWTKQYLRLKGIDAPELRNPGGLRARHWLERELSRCPFVIVKTSKSDQFDRYLADIFYLPACNDSQIVSAEGKYLNQELLNKDLAKLW